MVGSPDTSTKQKKEILPHAADDGRSNEIARTDARSMDSPADVESQRHFLLGPLDSDTFSYETRWTSESSRRWCCRKRLFQRINCGRVPRVATSFIVLLAVLCTGCVLGCFLFSKALTLIIILSAWLMSLALHEFGHAVVAYNGGDTSIADKGYLSLDIFSYADPIMTFILPTLLILAGGVALPGGSVTVATSSIRSRWVLTAVSIAGPSSNFIAAIAFAVILHVYVGLVGFQNALLMSTGPALALTIRFQIMAAVLNMLPLPPLDGWGCLAPWLPTNCFLLQWMRNPWRLKTITLCCLLAVFLFVRTVPGFAQLVDSICRVVLGVRPDLMQSGAATFAKTVQRSFE